MNIQYKQPGKMSDQQRIDPFELPNPGEWDENEEEENDFPKPGMHPGNPRKQNPSDNCEEIQFFEDELHDEWDLTSQPLNWG